MPLINRTIFKMFNIFLETTAKFTKLAAHFKFVSIWQFITLFYNQTYSGHQVMEMTYVYQKERREFGKQCQFSDKKFLMCSVPSNREEFNNYILRDPVSEGTQIGRQFAVRYLWVVFCNCSIKFRICLKSAWFHALSWTCMMRAYGAF